MSKRIATAVAALGAAGFISGCAFEQASPGCQVQDSDTPWQAVYTLKNPADASKSCGNLKGEAVGLWKYVKDPLTNPVNQLVIRPAGTASRFEYSYEYDGEDFTVERADPELATSRDPGAAAVTAKEAASTGPASLAMEPDDKGLCLAKDFTGSARVSASEVRHHVTGEQLVAAENVTYTYQNVQVYSAPDAPGTQMSGEFTYSDGTGCTAEYKMLALWPQVPCDPDAFANPTDKNEADRCGKDSGLNPDFDAVCVAGIGPDGEGGCVPNPEKGVPSFVKK